MPGAGDAPPILDFSRMCITNANTTRRTDVGQDSIKSMRRPEQG